MHLTARGEYALRAMLALAETYPALTTVDTLVTAQELPRKFLEAILADLRRGALLFSQRGPEGGHRLVRPPEEITIADVIRAVEGPLAEIRGVRPDYVSYTGAAEHLQTVWLALRASLRSVLENVTLAQVLAGDLPEHVRALASLPQEQRSGDAER